MQVAQALKMEPRHVQIKVTAKYAREGSVLAGTARSVCDSIKTELSLAVDESPDRIALLVRMAEATCFTMAALRHAAPLEFEASVNGEPVAL